MESILQDRKLNNLFEQKEKEIMNDVVSNAKNIAKTEMELFEFELLYSSMMNRKKSKAHADWVKKHRQDKWKEVLRRAKGDEEKALAIYDEI